jgi:hypothetical protein
VVMRVRCHASIQACGHSLNLTLTKANFDSSSKRKLSGK